MDQLSMEYSLDWTVDDSVDDVYTKYAFPFRMCFSHQVALNDKAHQWTHFDNVYTTGVLINQVLDLGYPKEAILLVAYLHDLFAWSRVNHHRLAYEFVLTSNHPLVMQVIDAGFKNWNNYGSKDEYREMLAEACRTHRASYMGEYATPFAELMASADFEKPSSLEAMLHRAHQYALSQGGSPDDALVASVKHVKEKFGRKGYANYPGMYLNVFGERIVELQAEIEKLTMDSDVVHALSGNSHD